MRLRRPPTEPRRKTARLFSAGFAGSRVRFGKSFHNGIRPAIDRAFLFSFLPIRNAASCCVGRIRPKERTASTVSPRPTHTHQVQHHLQTLHNQATTTTTTHRTHATYIPTHPYPLTASPRITSAAGKDVCFCAMPPRPGLTGESRPLRSRLSTRGGGTQTPTSHTSPKRLECPRTGIAHANAPHKFPV